MCQNNKDSFIIEVDIYSRPAQIYHDWLDTKSHSLMTGGKAEISPILQSTFEAWNGYIRGKTIELIPDQKIKQLWRSSAFKDEDEDSILEITFTPKDEYTQLILKHSNIPAGDGPKYKKGWHDFYFTPMNKYYGKE